MGKLMVSPGAVFGRWTVIKSPANRKSLCRCVCGNIKEVYSSHLTQGNSKSCGCLNSEYTANRNKTHGESKTRLYATWLGMKARCHLRTICNYKNYGGRGIQVCEEWANSFETFMDWAIHNGYKENLTIDREDNNLGYSPGNCRWADAVTQCNNRRNNRLVSINGATHTVAEWEKISGLTKIIDSRLSRGWVGEKLLAPIKEQYRNKNVGRKTHELVR